LSGGSADHGELRGGNGHRRSADEVATVAIDRFRLAAFVHDDLLWGQIGNCEVRNLPRVAREGFFRIIAAFPKSPHSRIMRQHASMRATRPEAPDDGGVLLAVGNCSRYFTSHNGRFPRNPA
jgi:hypothetical protein